MKKALNLIKLLLGILLIAGAVLLFRAIQNSNIIKNPFKLELSQDKSIERTPIVISDVNRIGQWEFLSIDDEELVDTSRWSFLFSQDQLVRIYRGTLRLGIDFEKRDSCWATCHKDTAFVVLPPVELLDENFINEADTKSFYQKGEWDASSLEQMYLRAKHQMIERCITATRIKQAEENARVQIKALFRSLGYNEVEITISPASSLP